MSRDATPKNTHKDAHQPDGFNRVAPLYDLTARLTFGGAIQRAQLTLIPGLEGARRALMIGGGAGAMLQEALERHPQLAVTYLEASSKMIELAQRRLTPQQRGRVTWLYDTHALLYNDPSFLQDADVLITCFFVDVLSPQEARQLIAWVTEHLGTRLAEGEARAVAWLIADFYPHSGWRGALIQAMYLAFKLLARLENQQLDDYPKVATERGWVTTSETWQAREMIYAKRLTLLRSPH